jgi:hypothetical protein
MFHPVVEAGAAANLTHQTVEGGIRSLSSGTGRYKYPLRTLNAFGKWLA